MRPSSNIREVLFLTIFFQRRYICERNNLLSRHFVMANDRWARAFSFPRWRQDYFFQHTGYNFSIPPPPSPPDNKMIVNDHINKTKT